MELFFQHIERTISIWIDLIRASRLFYNLSFIIMYTRKKILTDLCVPLANYKNYSKIPHNFKKLKNENCSLLSECMPHHFSVYHSKAL